MMEAKHLPQLSFQIVFENLLAVYFYEIGFVFGSLTVHHF